MSFLTRRRFLEDSAIAAGVAAALAAGLGEEAARAALEPENGRRRRVGPNDKIRVACIGQGGRGGEHRRSYLALPDVTVAAVCDIDMAHANRAADEVAMKTGVRPKVYQDLRKLYEDKDIDAVSCALPIHWHSLASIWAMQAGKDVYVEKPVCHNVTEGRRMIEAATKYGRICQAGTQSRSNKACKDATKYIHDGKIGKVSIARGLCYKRRESIGIKPDGPIPAGVDYDIWLGAAPKRAFNPNRFHYNWHWNWDYGAGDLGNQGIHQMDIARWALNKDRLPDSVYSFGGRFGYVDQGETPNTDVSVYDWADGSDGRLIFEVRGLATDPLKDVKIGDIIYGSDGYVVFTDRYGASVAFDNGGAKTATFTGGGNPFRNYIDAVKSRKMSDLNAPIHEGYLSSALCHLGNVSYRLADPMPFAVVKKHVEGDAAVAETYDRFADHLTKNAVDLSATPCRMGRTLKLDSRASTIKGDPEAAALLTRKYRAPFVVPDKV